MSNNQVNPDSLKSFPDLFSKGYFFVKQKITHRSNSDSQHQGNSIVNMPVLEKDIC